MDRGARASQGQLAGSGTFLGLVAVFVAAEMDCDPVAAENRDDQDQGEGDGRDQG